MGTPARKTSDRRANRRQSSGGGRAWGPVASRVGVPSRPPSGREEESVNRVRKKLHRALRKIPCNGLIEWGILIVLSRGKEACTFAEHQGIFRIQCATNKSLWYREKDVGLCERTVSSCYIEEKRGTISWKSWCYCARRTPSDVMLSKRIDANSMAKRRGYINPGGRSNAWDVLLKLRVGLYQKGGRGGGKERESEADHRGICDELSNEMETFYMWQDLP